MAIIFPDNPLIGDTVEISGNTWEWDGERWIQVDNVEVGFTGSAGYTGSMGLPGAPRKSEQFVGDGSNTIFTMTETVYNALNILVMVNGLVLLPDVDYYVENTELYFVNPPAPLADIEVRHFGTTGYRGSKGEAGYQGSKGEQGDPGGPRGYTGSGGQTGAQGLTGYRGSTGFVGSRGDRGFTGSVGPEGTPGTPGEFGYTGSRGEAGMPTVNQIFVANGVSSYVLDYYTESALHLLVAVNGLLQVPDNDYQIIANGTIIDFINVPAIDSDVEIRFFEKAGYAGSRGTSGYAGSQGELGFTGSIGPEGARGFAGSQGDTGYRGSLGFTGSTGPRGFTGSRGKAGISSLFLIDAYNEDSLTFNPETVEVIPSSSVAGLSTTYDATVFVFGRNEFTFSVDRRVTNIDKKVLTDVSWISFYINKGGGGWGDAPDQSQDESIVIEYSLDGILWVELIKIQPNSISSNVWLEKKIVPPTEARVPGGVYLRIRQLAATGGSFDNWAVSSLRSVIVGTDGYSGSRGLTGFVGSKGYSGSTGSGFTGSQGYTGSGGQANTTVQTFVVANGQTTFTLFESVISQNNTIVSVNGIVQVPDISYTIVDTLLTLLFDAPDDTFIEVKNVEKSVGSQGFSGSKGNTGYIGSVGFAGSVGQTGPVGYTGSEGFTGSVGYVGSRGAQGFIGYSGSRGPTGGFGGASFNYYYDPDTTLTNTPPGTLKFNATVEDLASATILVIDTLDQYGEDISLFLETIDNSTSVIKGHFTITERDSVDDYALFTIIGYITQVDSSFRVPINFISNTTTFNAESNVVISFARTGDIGDTGYAGSIGGPGYSGSIGYAGSLGYAGSQGYQGIQGFRGYTGSRGIQGVRGRNPQYLIDATDDDLTIRSEGASIEFVENITGLSQDVLGKVFAFGVESGVDGVFGGRSVFSTRVNLRYLDSAYYYINKGDGIWGAEPDTVTGIVFEYSVDGDNWVAIDTVLPSNVSPNVWTQRIVSIPAGARVDTGVYLRLRQEDVSGGPDSDNWVVSSVIAIYRGYDGSQGDIGFTGSAGVLGGTGYSGSRGYTGSIGFTGSRGLIGPIGARGDFGYTGSQGIGFTGSQGEQGTAGNDGERGRDTFEFLYTNWQAITDSIDTSGTNRVRVNTSPYWDEATVVYIDNLNYHGNISGVLNLMQEIGSYGALRIYVSATQFVVYQIDSFVYNEATDSYTIQVALIEFVGTRPSTGTDVYVAFQPYGGIGFTGSKGDKGYSGSKGEKGDPDGYTGSRGYTGSITTANSTSQVFFSNEGQTTYILFESVASQNNTIVSVNGVVQVPDISYTIDGTTLTLLFLPPNNTFIEVRNVEKGIGNIGEKGYTGSAGYIGLDGYSGSTGYTGSKGADGVLGGVGYTGSIGFTGSTGSGYVGSIGSVGYTGSRGIIGYAGGTSIDYVFRTYTTDSPGVAGTNFNNANLALADTAYFDYEDIYGIDNSQLISSLDNANANPKAYITVINRSDPSQRAYFELTGNFTSHTFHVHAPINYLSGVTSFNDYAGISVIFNRNGDKGDQGDVGYTGSAGGIGETGYRGSEGDIGPSGPAGYTGSAGDMGDVGYRGSEGYMGSSGPVGFTGSIGAPGGIEYRLITGTGDTDPGYGYFKLNSSFTNLTTQLYVNYNTLTTNIDVSNYIDTWDDSTSSVKGYIEFTYLGRTLAVFRVNSVEDATYYKRINVTYVSGELYVNDVYSLVFSRTGDIGDTGYTGSAGINYTGSAGYTGSVGDIGETGYKGSVGYDGSQGDPGAANVIFSELPPTMIDLFNGLLWFDSNTGYLSIFYDVDSANTWIGINTGGPQGYAGSQGLVGYVGSFGYSGSPGGIGETGYKGSVGFTGSVGYRGSEGNIGTTGYSGSTGIIDQTITVALAEEQTNLTSGTAKITIRAPFALTLTSIPRAMLATASSSGVVTVDINLNGTSILGTNKLSIDANEKTSTTAATATTLVTTSVADDDEITFDVDAAGTGARGLKATLYFRRV